MMKIIMYTTSWCPSCIYAKRFFNERNISIEEIDIEKEDTLTILDKYVDEIEYKDKPALKSILKTLYVEALEIV